MTIERTHQGAWRISDIVGDHLITRVYYGYTKSEAKRMFKQESEQ
jgi:hypothetical protein